MSRILSHIEFMLTVFICCPSHASQSVQMYEECLNYTALHGQWIMQYQITTHNKRQTMRRCSFKTTNPTFESQTPVES